MAGLFSSGEQDMLGNIVQGRQQANQALGSPYGKYGGIVQAGAALADVGADAMFGGKTGASDPRMQQMNEVKNIFAQVSQEVGTTTSAAFYEKLSQALSEKYPEQAQKAADKAMEIKNTESEMKPKDPTLDLLKTGKYTPESVKAAVKAKDFGLLKPVESTTKTPAVGANAELISQVKFNKTFAELSPEEKRVVYAEAQTETSLGQGLTVLGNSLVKSLGKQSGEDVAEAISPKVIQGKENTVSALTRAKELLGKGIYTGGLANAKMAVSKYSPLGSQEKLENTEKYLSYVSTTVIPLLKEFGGNDSNEELKFLQRLVGGEITLEEGTLEEIIDSAIMKTQRGIQRTKDSVENVTAGKMPSTEVTTQSYGAKPTPIGVGESTSVNGVIVKRVK